jgi:hypothetical protein
MWYFMRPAAVSAGLYFLKIFERVRHVLPGFYVIRHENKNVKRMKTIKVTYTVKPSFVTRNQENINVFIKALQKLSLPGIRYTVYLGSDGKTFTHFAQYDNDAVQKTLLELDAFVSFQKQRDESGLEVAPAIEAMSFVAASHTIFGEKN